MLLLTKYFQSQAMTDRVVELRSAYLAGRAEELTVGVETNPNLEDWFSDKYTPHRDSAIERREERKAREVLEGTSEFKVPTSIFERNVSPGLEKTK